MVMGPTHSMSGAAVGLAVAQALPASWGGVQSPTEAFIYAGITAGAALLPDLDSPQATVSRSFGPLSLGLSHVVENASQALVNITRGPKDNYCGNGHRTATHTIWFGLLMGVVSTAIIGAFGPNGAIGLLFLFLGLAIRGLVPDWAKKNGWVAITVISALLAWIAWKALPEGHSALVMGSAVTVGVLTHLAGDFITKDGIPALAPIVPVGQRRWWDYGLPSGLRISASGLADQVLLGAFSLLTVVQAFIIATSGNLAAGI